MRKRSSEKSEVSHRRRPPARRHSTACGREASAGQSRRRAGLEAERSVSLHVAPLQLFRQRRHCGWKFRAGEAVTGLEAERSVLEISCPEDGKIHLGDPLG